MRVITIALFTVAIAFLGVGCKNPLARQTTEVGSLRVSVPNAKHSVAKSILPADMSITMYRATGSGPGGASIMSTDSSSGSFSFNDLAVGSWTITVDGLDGSNNVIATGSATTSIEAGTTASATVQLTPATGTGTLFLTASWPAGKTVGEVSGTLTPDGGAAQPISLTISGTSASYTNGGIVAGSYVLVLNFKSAGVIVAAPRMETVLVYNGKTSSGSLGLTDSDFNPLFLRYDANGASNGTVPSDAGYYLEGAVAAVKNNEGNLAKTGFVFAAWNTKPDGSGTSFSPGSSLTINSANTTLFALWTRVAYDANGATGGQAPIDTTNYAQGSSVLIVYNGINLTKIGYLLAGWNTQSDYRGVSYSLSDGFYMPSSPVTLYAIWLPENVRYSISSGNMTLTGFSTPPVGAYVIPPGVVGVSSSAFSGCPDVTSIAIPAEVTSVDVTAFYGCGGLSSISVDAANPAYLSLSGVLYNKGSALTLVIVPATMSSLSIPDTVTSIASGAVNCSGSVPGIINVPASVLDLAAGSFGGWPTLASIIVDSANPNYASFSGMVFNKAMTNFVIVPRGIASVSFPPGIYSIPAYTFSGCSSLTSLTLNSNILHIYDQAFSWCTGLTSVTIPGSVTDIGNNIFAKCTNLVSVSLSYGMESCGFGTFESCTKLSYVNLPSSLISATDYAFYGCSSLTNIDLPAAIMGVGNHAFDGCSSLDTVNIYATNPPPFLGTAAFANCSSSLKIHVPSGRVAAYQGDSGWSAFGSNIVTP